MNGSLYESFLIKRNQVVAVNASTTNKELTTKWNLITKAKMWENENGFVVENASWTNLGKHIRLFYVYKNQECYSRGLMFESTENLRTAQLKAEAFKVSQS